MPKSLKKVVPAALLTITSLFFGICFIEIAYRAISMRNTGNYRIAPIVYGQYDKLYGEQFIPHSKLTFSFINDKRVVFCAGTVAEANSDGLGGLTTLNDAAKREFRILTTGDSITHWKRDGLTIPDVVEQNLISRTGRSIANLNYGRGTYGVLQMLSIAVGKGEDIKPNLIVIQFISDDLTRGRWWAKEIKDNGRVKARISPYLDEFLDENVANDEYIVDGRATQEWCLNQIEQDRADSVLDEANKYYSSYLNKKGRDGTSLTKLYVLDEFWHRFFGKPFYGASVIPHVDSYQFSADKEYGDAIARLKEMAIPIAIVHIPVLAELQAGHPILYSAQTRIWQQLESDFGQKIFTYWSAPDRPPVPSKIDLSPFDPHPNTDGIKFYGDYVSRIIAPLVHR